MDLAAQDRRDALETLNDLPGWHLPAAEWPPVARVLGELGTAVEQDDDAALARLIHRLEALSPLRIAAYDVRLAHPLPTPLLLLTNHLVHALTDPGTRPVPRAPTGPAALPTGKSAVRQEFVIHAYAPLDGPWSESAYQQVRRLWSRAAGLLGATRALGDLPVDTPEETTAVPSGAMLAARENAGRTVQLLLRREHDVLVLSICWRAGSGEAPGWDVGERQWSQIAGDDTGDLLGLVRLRVGTVPPDGPGDLFTGDFWEPGGVSAGPVTLWELPPFDEHDHGPGERTLLVLAPAEQETALSALVWFDGRPRLPNLARYLLDAVKVRYEIRVREAATGDISAALESGDVATLARLMSRLEDLRLTVDVARTNLSELTAQVGAQPAGLFADDRRLADWIHASIGTDLRYLTNARDRAHHTAPAAMSRAEPTIGIITAMNVEYAAMAAMLDASAERTIEGDDAPYRIGTVPSASDGPPHVVALVLLGGTANVDAAVAVTHLLRSFGTIREVLMVGIAAGVPAPRDPARHVRLGDIVAGTWGVVDYDHVVDRPGGATLRMSGPRPSYRLSQRVELLEAEVMLSGRRPWEDELDRLIEAMPDFARPGEDTDILYASDARDAERVEHPLLSDSGHRPGRPKVHRGRIGSASRSLRNARARDELDEKYDLRAIEMEGAGVSWSAHRSERGCLVIRGISDYADTRMSVTWRKYAAAVAAAYARALLTRSPSQPGR